MKHFDPSIASSHGRSLFLTFASFACFADHLIAAEAPKPAPREPERRELWVPSKHLEEVLKKHPNAVLLDRAQYEALIRDAGKIKTEDDKDKPPQKAVIEGVKLNVAIEGGAKFATVSAKLAIRHLVDGWIEGTLLKLPDTVRVLKVDGTEVGAWSGAEYKLALRGLGRHEVTMEFQAPVIRDRGVCHADVPLLGRPFTVAITTKGNVKLPEGWPQHDGSTEPPVAALVPQGGSTTLFWEELSPDAPATLRETAWCVAHVDGTQVETDLRLLVESSQGQLPRVLRFQLADDAHVVSVDDENVASWKQAGNVLEITRSAGLTPMRNFHLTLTRANPDGAGTIPLVIDTPRLIGASRVSASVAAGVGAGFEVLGWQTAPGAPNARFPEFLKEAQARGATLFARYEVAPEKIIANVRRLADRFSADVDNRIALSTHEMRLERSIALHGEEGRVNRAVISLPPGEQFLGLNAVGGERVEWKQVTRSEGIEPSPDKSKQGLNALATFEITWPAGLQKGQTTTLWLTTREDLPAELTAANAKPAKLLIENLRVPEAIRLAGYVALDFDDSWKITTTDTTGLEDRDARVTPVKGRMAWFTLREHKLALDIARNEPVLDAAVIAYALPRAKNIEIEGQFSLNIERAPLRKFDVKLAPAVSKLLRVDSPLIASQLMDADGTWHFSLKKELQGAANLRFHMSLAAEKKLENRSQKPDENQDASAKENLASVLTATLPRFILPASRRFTGAWVIEANTDTEITSITKGVQPLDGLRAPVVEGYAPRHRVIAAFGYGSSEHEVKITATRHDPGALVSAVVEVMDLTSVLSTDGSSRHQVVLKLKHNGQQFFGLRLPRGAMPLSAKVQNEAVKPVRAGEDELRVPLAGYAVQNECITVTVIYELTGEKWHSSGSRKLEPPTVGEDVPVLSTRWRVFAPDGFTHETPNSHLPNALREWGSNTTLGCLADAVGIEHRWLRTSAWFERAYLSLNSNGIGDPAKPHPDAVPMLKERGPPRETMQLQIEYPKAQFMGTPVPMNVPVTGNAQKTKMSVSPSDQIIHQLQTRILPSVQFSGATIEEAVDFLRLKLRGIDTDGGNGTRRPINIVVKNGSAPSTATINLDLRDVPAIDALRYITELAGMKYKIEDHAVVILPLSDISTEQFTRTFKVAPDFLVAGAKLESPPEIDPFTSLPQKKPALSGRPVAPDILRNAGVGFPEGASAVFNPATSTLTVKNTQPNLDAVEAFVDMLGRGNQMAADFLPARGGPARAVSLSREELERRKIATKSGLISLDLEVPTSGRVLEFRGHQKPEIIELRYQSWERQMFHSVLWMLVGIAAFLIAGRRRPWRRTFVTALLLTCVPLLWLPSWLIVGNAVLAGWLVAFTTLVASRLAHWLERKLTWLQPQEGAEA